MGGPGTPVAVEDPGNPHARRIASLVAGRPAGDAGVPIFRGELPGHASAPFRRIGQWSLYRHYARRDEQA